MKNIGIIGNGFVGSAIASGFGLHERVRIYDKDIRRAMNSLYETVNESEYIFICVPTPMKSAEGDEIDLSIMDSILKEINDCNERDDNILIIKSTVIPGTVDKYSLLYPNLNIVFNPEFLTERSANLDFINASRVIIGGPTVLSNKVEKLYRNRFPYVKIIKTDAKSAEFIKYMCNCFFATKISFMNEMFLLATKLDFDWQKIMEGFVADGRIGNSHLDVPGHDGDYGFGGKCFPKDLNALIGFFQDNEIEPHVLKAAWERNKVVRKNRNWEHIEGAVSKDKK